MEVVLNHKHIVPSCSHGPCLLFKRSEDDVFFACAVFRSRKHCPFYQSLTDPVKSNKHPTGRSEITEPSSVESMKRLKKVRSVPETERRFCQTCSCFIVAGKEMDKHGDHDVTNQVADSQLKNPTRILIPHSDKQKEAQFWFSNRTLNFLKSIARDEVANYDSVLCIGAPRVFEALQSSKKRGTTYLLDFDSRFGSFWSSKKFAKYSMLVHHFFDEKAKRNFEKFLENSKKLLIFIDPPFGVLMAPLAHSLEKIRKMHAEFSANDGDRKSDIAMTLPYFLDKKVEDHLPQLKPLDYRIEYESTGVGSKKDYSVYKDPSRPVRIFTSIPPDAIKLPINEGYRFCEFCKIFVAKENAHCKQCRKCTMRGTKPYKHCGKCQSCVPSNTEHCSKCKKCHKQDSECHQEKTSTETQKSSIKKRQKSGKRLGEVQDLPGRKRPKA